MKGFRTSCSFSSPELSLSQGSSTAKSAVRRTEGTCSPICPATPTASRSRTAVSSRLDDDGVTFSWKDYRIEGRDRLQDHDARRRTSSSAASFSTCCPSGFHRIRHYGFLASPGRAATIGRLRDLIAASDATARPRPETDASSATTGPEPATTQDMDRICPCCGGRMRIIETFARGAHPRSFTSEPAGIDSS